MRLALVRIQLTRCVRLALVRIQLTRCVLLALVRIQLRDFIAGSARDNMGALPLHDWIENLVDVWLYESENMYKVRKSRGVSCVP